MLSSINLFEPSFELHTHDTPAFVTFTLFHFLHFFGFDYYISLTVFTLAQTHTLCIPLLSCTCTSLFNTMLHCVVALCDNNNVVAQCQ